MSTKTTEQALLQSLVGNWTYEFATACTSEYPGVTSTGTETVRRIGETWVLIENQGVSSEGSASHSVTTLGFSVETGRFVGAVAGTAVPTTLFIYDGGVGAPESAIHLDTTGPAMTPGNSTDRYRDVIQFTGPDARETIAQVLDTDGKWVEFMRTRYRRAQ
jgi:Protein of unknown function (DUF1579)